MANTADLSGVARYVDVKAHEQPQKPKIDNTPPGAVRFIGEPQVSVDAQSGNRVYIYVVQPTLLRARGVVVNDIHRVRILPLGEPTVKRYPKPVAITEKFGPGAPLIWSSSKEIPKGLLDAIQTATDKGLIDTVPAMRKYSVANALERLGLSVDRESIASSFPINTQGRNL